ncbi:MAG: outer membrane lipoprotein-sorting protein [Sterolibacterium sp.]
MVTQLLAIALAMWSLQSLAADSRDSLPGLLEAIKQARHSDGFEVRFAITAVDAQKLRTVPVKIAVIGQANADRQRFLVRGISPDAVRNQHFVAENSAAGPIDAFEYGPDSEGHRISLDPFARLFNTDFVMWDLFAVWWDWPHQIADGNGEVNGRSCLRVKSRPAVPMPVKEVVSCIDRETALALSTQVYDAQHRLRRTIRVEKLMRKGSSEGLMAKKLSILGEHGATSEIDVYGGDEQYRISPETFGVLDRFLGKAN